MDRLTQGQFYMQLLDTAQKIRKRYPSGKSPDDAPKCFNSDIFAKSGLKDIPDNIQPAIIAALNNDAAAVATSFQLAWEHRLRLQNGQVDVLGGIFNTERRGANGSSR